MGKTNVLTLTVWAKPGATFTFKEKQFLVGLEDTMVEIKPRRIVEYEVRKYGPNVESLFTVEDLQEMNGGKIYFIEFEGLPTNLAQFSIHIPPFIKKSKELTVPTITFVKLTEWRMEQVSLNC